MGHLSMNRLIVEGLEGSSFTGYPGFWGCEREALGTGISLHGVSSTGDL
jgi:hypothetical protein